MPKLCHRRKDKYAWENSQLRKERRALKPLYTSEQFDNATKEEFLKMWFFHRMHYRKYHYVQWGNGNKKHLVSEKIERNDPNCYERYHERKRQVKYFREFIKNASSGDDDDDDSSDEDDFLSADVPAVGLNDAILGDKAMLEAVSPSLPLAVEGRKPLVAEDLSADPIDFGTEGKLNPVEGLCNDALDIRTVRLKDVLLGDETMVEPLAVQTEGKPELGEGLSSDLVDVPAVSALLDDEVMLEGSPSAPLAVGIEGKPVVAEGVSPDPIDFGTEGKLKPVKCLFNDPLDIPSVGFGDKATLHALDVQIEGKPGLAKGSSSDPINFGAEEKLKMVDNSFDGTEVGKDEEKIAAKKRKSIVMSPARVAFKKKKIAAFSQEKRIAAMVKRSVNREVTSLKNEMTSLKNEMLVMFKSFTTKKNAASSSLNPDDHKTNK